ncbi:MAG: hypothetical protein ACOZNI_09325 [Myxococcota bacterium]
MLVALAFPAFAGEDEPDAPPPELPAEALEEAEETRKLSRKELRKLKPSPFHLPQNPRGQVDFTAYTLEWGEVKLGLANVTVGVLPHVQLGTSVPLDVLGVPNVTAKAHAAEGGPYDIAGYVNYYVLPREAIQASYLSVGGLQSLRILEPWSVHVGGGYVRVHAAGQADIGTLADLWGATEGDAELSAEVTGHAVNLTVATDVRLNRRDSVILRGESLLWAKTEADVPEGVINVLGLQDAFATNGFLPLSKASTASIAWQFAWEHVELRLGVGVPLLSPAWFLQSAELCYRFGGPTRVRERKQRETWEKNRKELKQPEPAPPETPPGG